jgi:adenine-specific DNA-methyltransferase
MDKMDGKTMDIVAENVGKLKGLFPEAFTEGKVDFEALKEVLGTFVDDRDERYSFTWNGKSKSRMIAQTPSTGTLRPCKEESVDWDTTQNIFIEGDNLEVLKLLQKSYHKKVKMIYIDPPYNTGKDFVYKDNFKDNIKNYKEITGQVDGEGRNLSNNPETSGRYHTDWLNMMYPRLKLARNLLKDDGVIFISIDDNEVSNLRKMCDEIFGEENFIADLVWSNKEGGGSSDTSYFRIKHEHVLCFAKNIELAEIIGVEISNRDRYRGSDEYEGVRGPYYLQKLGMGSIQYSESLDYEIITPDGSTVTPKDNNNGRKACWRWSRQKYDWGVENDFTVIKKDSSGVWTVYTKQYLNCDNEGTPITRTQRPMGVIDEFSSTQASKYLEKLGIGNLFNYTKPYQLISWILHRVIRKDDIVLDFFAGSSTTAEALFRSSTNLCHFIMVQLPELCDENKEAFKAGYKTIAEISKERIRRASAMIKEENPGYDGDLGFKVFKLDSTNIKPWEVDFDLTAEGLFDYVENIKPNRREEDVLYEILLKYGLDLTLPISEHAIAGQKVFNIGMGALIICLADAISLDVVEGMAKLKEELNPEIMRVVFKDSGFKDDVVKTNAVQILKQAGINDVRSL